MKLHKTAFTLAEVLITLAIIGVVAAITVPVLMRNTNNEQFKSAAYKHLSVLNNAIRQCYVIDGEKMDQFENADDLKNNFFYKYFFKHLNKIGDNGNIEASNDWGNGLEIENSFYVNDGAKYGIGEKITDTCEYYIHNFDDNMPCFIIYVDVNGDRKPNKITESLKFYKDINLYYVYSDRIVMQPGGIQAPEEDLGGDDTPSGGDTPGGGGGDTPGGGGGDTPGGGGGDTPGGGGDDTPGDDTPGSDDPGGHSMKRCLEKRSMAECLKFCKQNGYHSALCK